MKKYSIKCLISSIAMVLGASAHSVNYWPPELSDWKITLNNGVVYVESSQIPNHCAYSRAQINVNESEYNKAMFSYILAAKARGKNLKYVVDNATSACVIYGVSEQ